MVTYICSAMYQACTACRILHVGVAVMADCSASVRVRVSYEGYGEG